MNHPMVKEEIKDFLVFKKNEHTTYPNLWDTMKVALRQKFISAYIMKVEKSHTSNLTTQLKF